MHYDSKHNTKKRTSNVDLFDRETPIQLPPVAQVSLPVPVALAGHDPLRTMRHEWWTK
jgi:hypothetical protein